MTKELGSIETLRTDFVVAVSHEFKTPLTAIEGYTALLQNGNLSAAQHDECVDKITANVHRLSTLTGNILQLSKLENQGIVADKKSYSLDEQLRKSILLLEREWTAKNIEFDLDLLPVQFNGSESLLYQVWYNLIQNAVKFSPDGGMIHIKLQLTEDKVVVCVADNGCGIDEASQKHIFDKFYQGNKAHASEGNGLGLALVYKIVTLCGGTISVDSQPEQGAAFTVTLPRS